MVAWLNSDLLYVGGLLFPFLRLALALLELSGVTSSCTFSISSTFLLSLSNLYDLLPLLSTDPDGLGLLNKSNSPGLFFYLPDVSSDPAGLGFLKILNVFCLGFAMSNDAADP